MIMAYLWHHYGNLWRFYKNPVCPDPVWKPVRYKIWGNNNNNNNNNNNDNNNNNNNITNNESLSLCLRVYICIYSSLDVRVHVPVNNIYIYI